MKTQIYAAPAVKGLREDTIITQSYDSQQN